MSSLVVFGIFALCVVILVGMVSAFLTVKHMHNFIESRPYCMDGLEDDSQDLDAVVDLFVLCNSNDIRVDV